MLIIWAFIFTFEIESVLCLHRLHFKVVSVYYWADGIYPLKILGKRLEKYFLVNSSQLIIKSSENIFELFVPNENYKICNKNLSQPLFEIDYNRYQGT